METLPDTTGNFERALELAKLGYPLIPLLPGTKVAAVKWKRFQDEMPTAADYERWFSTEGNVAIVTGNDRVVVDVDDPKLLDQVIEHCGDTPMKCRTPSGGVHLYYRTRKGVLYGNGVKVKGKPIDLQWKGAYAACPWSENYEWLGEVLPVHELPLLKVSWLRERKRKVPMTSAETCTTDNQRAIKPVNDTIKDIRSYIRSVPSVMGSSGNKGLMRVCFLLAERFDFDTALSELLSWNRAVPQPEWEHDALVRALMSAYRYKLKERMG